MSVSARQRLRGGLPAAPRVEDPVARRFLAWETVIVLAIFPLPAVITAFYYLALHLDLGVAITRDPSLPHWQAVAFLLAAALQLSRLAAAALVLYLLARAGEGAGAIGLGRRDVRTDLALVFPVWVLTQLIPMRLGSFVVRQAHLHAYRVVHFPHVAPVLSGLTSSVVAGVVEEVVVLGYLVRRLEQRGWSPHWVVAAAVLVRVSYHLYYGPGVVPIVFWAVATVFLYRRIRRLAPFVICHVMWDAVLTLRHWRAGVGGAVAVVFFFASLAGYLRWRNWRLATVPTSEPQPAL